MLLKMLDIFGFRNPSPPPSSQLQRGDIASVATDDATFGVVKILETDGLGVHVRLYVQRFTERPTQIDAATLTTAPYGPEHDNPLSFGHMPMAFPTFDTWEPQLISRGHLVSEDELVGYRIWQGGGGYF